jgi:TPR repeat protein
MDGREDYLANLSKARLGDAKAMYNVGICYQSGIGVEIDIDRSIEWYEMSAEHGFDEALILLEGIFSGCKGFVLQFDIDHSRFINISKYIKCVELGCKKGYPISLYDKGNIHRDGLGDYKKSLKEAVQCWLKVIEMDFNWAYNFEKNNRTPFGVYERLSATYAIINSYHNLGISYFHGSCDLLKDIDKAIYYLGEAAILGNMKSASDLIDIYLEGKGVPIDEKKAEYWMKIRRENGKPILGVY